ncbi:MAG: biotin/lipoyl-binding protein [Planctomycetes bacterium]|nr:biotin/lipoyl-binding protein [Planctomycetota bacterium]
MKHFVTVNEQRFTVELDGNWAIVECDAGRFEIELAPVSNADGSISELRARNTDRESDTVTIALWGAANRQTSDTRDTLLVQGKLVDVDVETERDRLRRKLTKSSSTQQNVTLCSPLPGIIRQIFIFPGNPVAAGEAILTLEAMKMENEVRAESDGIVESLMVEEGQVVNSGDALVKLAAATREA